LPKEAPVTFSSRALALTLLVAAPTCCNADDDLDCFADEVEVHVLEQFGSYGPLSTDREYFGFVFRLNGVIASAIARGRSCKWTQACAVNTGAAASLIPKGAKVLGEWHTHPHATGSQTLSPEDVRGANRNLRIRCYRAFFSMSNGEIHSWNPAATLVPAAMASSIRLGNYRKRITPIQSAAATFAARLR
jgi:hypothetical protein